jgi:transcriptional regulator with XRE-family HTH domain
MENLGRRIEQIMQKRGLNPNRLALMTGIHPTTIKNYLKGVGKPDVTKLDKIAEKLDISSDWLKTGLGESDSPKNKIPNSLEYGIKDKLISVLENSLKRVESELDRALQEIERLNNK